MTVRTLHQSLSGSEAPTYLSEETMQATEQSKFEIDVFQVAELQAFQSYFDGFRTW